MSKWRLKKVPGSYERTVPVEVTVERLREHRAQFGITRVTEVTGLDEVGMPVHAAFRPRSRCQATSASGKGLTKIDSLASALAEAAESDCCERFEVEQGAVGSYRELRRQGLPVVLPREGIPGGRPIDPDLSLEWMPADDLLAPAGEQRVLIPVEFVRQGSVGHKRGKIFDARISHGIASGNIYEEAVNHAIGELVERDAIATLLFRAKYCAEPMRRKYSRIRIRSLPERARTLAERMEDSGRTVDLLSIGDPALSISVIHCTMGACTGAGASLDAEHAVLRAMTEAVQTSGINIQGAREDFENRDPRILEKGRGLENPQIRALMWDPLGLEIDFRQLPHAPSEYVDEDLAGYLECLRAGGIERVLIADVTPPFCRDWFRVVRAIIPQLETPRLDTLGPRRLRHAFA